MGHSTQEATAPRLRHAAFLYQDQAEYAERMVPFLSAGLDAGEAVLAVAPRDRLAVLRDGLGDDADRVTFLDSNSVYTRPARALAAYAHTVRDRVLTTSSVRAVAELPAGPTRADWDEWTRYEAIVNRALEALPLWVVCAYSEREMPPELIDAMWRTHPEVGGDESEASPLYEDPLEVLRTSHTEPRELSELRATAPGTDPESFRETLALEMAAAGLGAARGVDMLLAANEVAENAWEHGGGVRELRVGRVDGRFVCEVVDAGDGFDDPFAGFMPPEPRSKPAGLFVARQLTWKLEHFRSDRGHTVRLWL